MKTINLSQSIKSEPDDGFTSYTGSTTAFSKTKTLLLSFITGLFLFFLPLTTFAQEQQDLRLLTDAYTEGKCPANDIQILGATLITSDPCATCTPGTSITADLKITMTNITGSDRYFAIMATVVGGTPTNISRCYFAPKNSTQIFDAGQITFTCGSAVTLDHILLAWTAASGECPVTLANNPNGKYCFAIPPIIVSTPFAANPVSTCSATEVGKMNVALNVSGGSGNFSFLWSDGSTDGNRNNITIGAYTVTVTDNVLKDANGVPCSHIVNVAAAENCCVNPNAGTDGSTTICDSNLAVINLFDLITGEQAGGTWSRTSGTGGTFSAANGTFTPAVGASAVSTFTYLIEVADPCVDDSSVATVNINAQPTAGADGSTTVCDSSVAAIDLFGLITGEQAGGTWSRTSGTGGTFSAANGTFTPAVGASAVNTFTYTVVGVAPCVDDSSIATVNISPQPFAGDDGSTTVCPDSVQAISLSSLLTNAQPGGTWSLFSGTGGTFDAVAGTFIPAPGASSSLVFRYTIIGAAPCVTDFSDVTVNINAVSPGAIAGDQSGCAPFDPVAFTNTTPGSGGTITYQWQISTTGCGGTFTDIPDATSATYDAPAVSVTTNFRRVAISTLNGVACSANSNCLTVTPVSSNPIVLTCPEPQTPAYCGLTVAQADAQIALDFAAFLAGFSYTGGINPVLVITPTNPTPPSFAVGGFVDVTWTVTGDCEQNACTRRFTVDNACNIVCASVPTNVDCYGGSTGTITVYGSLNPNLPVSGGTPPYSFSLYSSADVLLAGPQASNVFTGLAAGSYIVKVSDALTSLPANDNRCISNVSITQPASALDLQALGFTDVTCESANTGTITATFSGGTPPYTIQLDGGAAFTATSPYVFMNVSAGPHTVTVFDANYAASSGAGCTDQESVTVGTANCVAEGCTLGYWKNHTDRWCDAYQPNTLYGSVFASAPDSLKNLTLLQVLNLGGGGVNNLGRQSVAALLNICHDDVSYPAPYTSITSLVDAVNAAFTAGGKAPGNLANALDILNNSGCPLGGTSATSKFAADTSDIVPTGTSLNANFEVYPVPFKDLLSIRYKFDYKTDVKIEMFDVLGRVVFTFDDKEVFFGKEVTLHPEFIRDAGAMYFIKVTTSRGYEIRKIVSGR